ncbi:MAG: nucleotidyltransferase domain-containing protein [Candidatus Pacearchaeota archaeon]|nr:nucleotidyltransferase domain-containing protein [Candidatus Pacearchaeota archaeon]
MFKELNILKIFFESPTREFNVREVSRILKITPATASTKLKELAKRSFLKERRERNLILYKADLESEICLESKIAYNIRKIKESGLIEELNKFYIKPAIVLFGSAAKGLDIEDSDIDLVVISEKNREFTNVERFQKKTNRNIQLFIVKKIKDLKNEHLINNVINGITLQGELKWI